MRDEARWVQLLSEQLYPESVRVRRAGASARRVDSATFVNVPVQGRDSVTLSLKGPPADFPRKFMTRTVPMIRLQTLSSPAPY